MLIPKENQKLQSLIDKYAAGSQNAFAAMIGVTQSNINRLFRIDDRNKEVPNVLKSRSVLTAIKNKFPFADIEWFKKEEGAVEPPSVNEADLVVREPYVMDYVENSNYNTFMKLPNGQYLMTMPLAEFAIQAGFLDHYQDLEFLADMPVHSIIVDKPVKGRYVAYRVKGDSMDSGKNDAIMQNNIVACRELQMVHWSSKIRFKDFPYWVIYTTQSQYPLLKEIVAHDTQNGTIRCHSLNEAPEYTDFELSLNDVQALFYVVDVSRSVSKKINYQL